MYFWIEGILSNQQQRQQQQRRQDKLKRNNNEMNCILLTKIKIKLIGKQKSIINCYFND